MTTTLHYPAVLIGLLASGLTGCSPASAPVAADDEKAFAAPVGLTATLSGSGDVDLTWNHSATEPGGYWVEWATPGESFVKLAAVWSHSTSVRHPNVSPDTRHLYRVIPFFGRTSDVVEVTTGATASEEQLNSESEGPVELESLVALGLVPLAPEGSEPAGTTADAGASAEGTTIKASVRKAGTAPDAAPFGLRAKLTVPVNVLLRWTDRAMDEDGYLVEISADPDEDFRICALLPPDTVSFRKIRLAANTKFYFRVRAFFYGEPSGVATVNVGNTGGQTSAALQ